MEKSHNLALLAPINFVKMPFYLSHASNSDGITRHKTTNSYETLHNCITVVRKFFDRKYFIVKKFKVKYFR